MACAWRRRGRTSSSTSGATSSRGRAGRGADPGLGQQALVVQLHRQPNACRRLFGTALAALGQVDVLVNDAGLASGGPAAGGCERRGVQQVIAVNIRGAISCAGMPPSMIEAPDGSVLNISSGAGLHRQLREQPPAPAAPPGRAPMRGWPTRSPRPQPRQRGVNYVAPGPDGSNQSPRKRRGGQGPTPTTLLVRTRINPHSRLRRRVSCAPPRPRS